MTVIKTKILQYGDKEINHLKKVYAIIGQQISLKAVHTVWQKTIETLVLLKGIGKWTAEMILLNAMERPDIISYDDIAIRRGMMILYGLSEITKEEFLKYREKYSPYASIASIYLWRISYNYSKVGDK